MQPSVCMTLNICQVIKLGAKAIMAWFDERGGYGVKESPESEEPAAQ